MSFKFKLKSRVKLSESEEQGNIVGRAEYANGNENAYWICYKAGDGRQIERWWNESQLVAVAKTRAKKTKKTKVERFSAINPKYLAPKKS